MDKKKQKNIFGTDGVRGHANRHPMSAEVALSLGRAVAKVLKSHHGHNRVVIGKDTRLSCYMFENALVAGLCSMGFNTLMTGPLPTPGIAFLTRAYRADAGIVISASHNPYYDNGIKIFNSHGFKLSDDLEEEISECVINNDFDAFLPDDKWLGRNTRVVDADGRYIEFIKATFPKGKTLKDMTIVIDCANGAAHRVAPLAFWELDAKVIVIGDQPNGININDHCGSLYPQRVQEKVVEEGADVGIALDGDGDRAILVDELGQIVDGDILLAICGQDFKERGVLTNDTLVATVMTNLGVIKHLEAMGIQVHLSPVGDRYVIQEMLAKKSNLGGEQSGHLIFLDHNTTGDGLVSAFQVLRIMREKGMKLSQLAARVRKFPQVLINLRVREKPNLAELVNVQKTIREVELALQGQGRVLVRYSGTELVCRVMVEGMQREAVTVMAEKIAGAIKQEIGM